jgi:hypothetical protein
MVQATVKMHNLQELVRKVYLEGLINNAVIIFKDNRMKIEAIGIEDEQGVVDQTLTVDVNYPCESMTEAGEVSLSFIDDDKKADFLPKLELFERDDIVQISTTQTQLIISRTSPQQVLTYDLLDRKFVKTYSTGLKMIFGTPIKIIKADGKEKLIAFDSSVILDAQKLKEHGTTISKIKANLIPLRIRDGKLTTEVKGETSSLTRDVDGVTTAIGNASSQYSKDLLTIFKMGIGTATIKFSEMSPVHIHFEHESMSFDALLQVKEDNK